MRWIKSVQKKIYLLFPIVILCIFFVKFVEFFKVLISKIHKKYALFIVMGTYNTLLLFYAHNMMSISLSNVFTINVLWSLKLFMLVKNVSNKNVRV